MLIKYAVAFRDGDTLKGTLVRSGMSGKHVYPAIRKAIGDKPIVHIKQLKNH